MAAARMSPRQAWAGVIDRVSEEKPWLGALLAVADRFGVASVVAIGVMCGGWVLLTRLVDQNGKFLENHTRQMEIQVQQMTTQTTAMQQMQARLERNHEVLIESSATMTELKRLAEDQQNTARQSLEVQRQLLERAGQE